MKTNKKRKLRIMLALAFLYLFILFYAGYLSVLQIINMITNKNSDWIMMLLVIFVLGAILDFIIKIGKAFKRDYIKAKKIIKPYVLKRMKKILRAKKKIKQKSI